MHAEVAFIGYKWHLNQAVAVFEIVAWSLDLKIVYLTNIKGCYIYIKLLKIEGVEMSCNVSVELQSNPWEVL